MKNIKYNSQQLAWEIRERKEKIIKHKSQQLV